MGDRELRRFDEDGWSQQGSDLYAQGPDEHGMYRLPGTAEDAMHAASFFNPEDDAFPYQSRLREMSYRVPWGGAWTPVHIVIMAQQEQVGYLTEQQPAQPRPVKLPAPSVTGRTPSSKPNPQYVPRGPKRIVSNPMHHAPYVDYSQIERRITNSPLYFSIEPDWRLELEECLQAIVCRPDDPHGDDYRRIAGALIDLVPEGEPALEAVWRMGGKPAFTALLAQALENHWQRVLATKDAVPGLATMMMVANQEAARSRRPERKQR